MVSSWFNSEVVDNAAQRETTSWFCYDCFPRHCQFTWKDSMLNNEKNNFFSKILSPLLSNG